MAVPAPALDSLNNDNDNDNDDPSLGLVSRPGSIFGSRFSISDDSGIYISSLILTILISGIVMIGIILVAVTITLLVMLMACQKGSQAALACCQKPRNPDQCSSFVLNAEVNNLQGWMVPKECEKYVGAYMSGGQYENDVAVALSGARQYLKSFSPKDDGQDVVVMDIDETVLSNLPFYAKHHYGVEKIDENVWDEWVNESRAPALKPTLEFYKDIQSAKWNIIFITGRHEYQRNETVKNLLFAGYKNWLMLILRSTNEAGLSAELYKSNRRVQLEEQGYRIWSAFGDQWSDIEGPASGNRTFKIPNPMYYLY